MREVPGQRLLFFSQVWHRYGALPEVLDIIEKGHEIKFDYGCPPLSVPDSAFETRLSGKDKVVREGLQVI